MFTIDLLLRPFLCVCVLIDDLLLLNGIVEGKAKYFNEISPKPFQRRAIYQGISSATDSTLSNSGIVNNFDANHHKTIKIELLQQIGSQLNVLPLQQVTT